jgi:hypothetical protein
MNSPGQQSALKVPELDLHKILATLEKARTCGAASSVTVHFTPNGGVISITQQSEWKIK